MVRLSRLIGLYELASWSEQQSAYYSALLNSPVAAGWPYTNNLTLATSPRYDPPRVTTSHHLICFAYWVLIYLPLGLISLYLAPVLEVLKYNQVHCSQKFPCTLAVYIKGCWISLMKFSRCTLECILCFPILSSHEQYFHNILSVPMQWNREWNNYDHKRTDNRKHAVLQAAYDTVSSNLSHEYRPNTYTWSPYIPT